MCNARRPCASSARYAPMARRAGASHGTTIKLDDGDTPRTCSSTASGMVSPKKARGSRSRVSSSLLLDDALIPSAVRDTMSNTPAAGLVKTPATPCATPLPKPRKPPFFAPSTGFVKTPVKPDAKPEPSSFAPSCSPSPTCETRTRRRRRARRCAYSSSIESAANPLPAAPDMAVADAEIPLTVDLSSDEVPDATPRPKASGDSTMPCAGA
mmetsp:Transcript_1461/g.4622  ORF Transcript_1461/g.4622 Transcript_1461/m.4622 type:complete len:211 (-) Transcript_1461:3867-4499(-)